MGSGASVQAEQQRQQPRRDGEKEEEDRAKGKSQSKKVEIVTTYASVTPGSVISQMIKKPEWRDALKNKDLSHNLHRKMRAAALGLYNEAYLSKHQITLWRYTLLTAGTCTARKLWTYCLVIEDINCGLQMGIFVWLHCTCVYTGTRPTYS